MGTIHPRAAAVVEPFLKQVDSAAQQSYSAVLYGSAVRGGYRPGESDLNLLLIFDRLDPADITRLGPSLRSLEQDGNTPPLLFTRAEWERAADTFPIEITDMRLAAAVLRGTDPLAAMRVDAADLRRALEREFRGKLLRLRQGFAVYSSDESMLAGMARQSLGTVLLLARTTLAMLGRPVPETAGSCLTEAAVALGIEGEAWTEVLRWSERGDTGGLSADMFSRYLAALVSATAALDTLHAGES